MKKFIIAFILFSVPTFFFFNQKGLQKTSSAQTPWFREKSIPVLCYHNIDEKNGPGIFNLSREKFKGQMDWLKQEGFETISLMDFFRFIQGENVELPEKPILITFDDGNKGVHKYARKILNALNYKMVLFIYPTIVGRKKNTMTWEEIKEVAQDGHEIQSHTLYHPRLDLMNYKEQLSQYNSSKSILEEQIGGIIQFLAYPFGIFNKFSKQALLDSKYLAAFTIFPGANRKGTDPYLLNRYMVVNYHSLKDFQSRLKLESLPFYQTEPPQGSFLTGSEKISVKMPASLDESRFIIYAGKDFFLKNSRHGFSYDSGTGLLQIPAQKFKKKLYIISIRYEQQKTVYLNSLLYAKGSK